MYYKNIINAFPPIDFPSIFGMHQNADISFRYKESKELLDAIIDIQPKESSGGGGGLTREEIVQEKISEFLQILPGESDFSDLECKDKIRKIPGPKQLADKEFKIPLNIFLFQEVQRMHFMVNLIRRTLKGLNEAIDGVIIMTPDLQEALNAIFDSRVPRKWLYDAAGAEISWLSSNLGMWKNQLGDRSSQYKKWIIDGRCNSFRIDCFFNPQGFITAVKQEITRINKAAGWSLDDVIPHTTVNNRLLDPEQAPSPSDKGGVHIHGLFMDGGKYHKDGRIDESEPKQL